GKQSSRRHSCAPLLVCAQAFHRPLPSRDIQPCSPCSSNPPTVRQSPHPPSTALDRRPTSSQDLCALEMGRFSSPPFRHTPQPESCPEASPRCGDRPAVSSFADTQARSVPVAPAACRSDGAIAAHAARPSHPWLRYF